jgi:hypothetical protein
MELMITIVNDIATSLGIDPTPLIHITKQKFNDKKYNITSSNDNSTIINKINELIQNDKKIKIFEETKLYELQNSSISTKFKKLKENLGTLEVATILKQLEACKSNEEMLNTLLSILSNKLNSFNTILSYNSTGGGNALHTNNYHYKKYIIYKNKYINLKNKHKL